MIRPLPNTWLCALPDPPQILGPHCADDEILLHLGEAWYPPSPAVIGVLSSNLPVHRYPDSRSQQLREALAEYCGKDISANHIVVGNGSDALIDLIISAYADLERPVVAPAPTFFAYASSAISRHIDVVTTGRHGREQSFSLDADLLIRSLPPTTGVVFIASPNNPTGEYVPIETIRQIALATTGVVVVDECYYEFAGETALTLIEECRNVVILRSFSKSFALAGLRVGYAVADPSITSVLSKVSQTFPVNILAQKCAIAALSSLDYYRPLFAKTLDLRSKWQSALTGLGFNALLSRANIMLIEYSNIFGNNLSLALRNERIHVADFHVRGDIRDSIRLSVHTLEILDRVIASLKKILST